MLRRQPFYNLSSPVFILFYNRIVYQKKASITAILYVLIAMLGVFLMATKGDLSQLSMTPLALSDRLAQCSRRSCLMSSCPNDLPATMVLYPLLVGGLILAGLFSNLLYPVHHVTFQLDASQRDDLFDYCRILEQLLPSSCL